MRRSVSICIAGGLLLMLGSSPGRSTTIRFESLMDIEEEVVDNQFLCLGADFADSAMGLSQFAGSLKWGKFQPYSGDKVIHDSLGDCGTMRVDAVGAPWNVAGGYVTGDTVTTLTAYNAGGSVLATCATGGANYVGVGTGLPPNIFLSVKGPGIAYGTLTGGGSSQTLDDSAFEAVCAPGAILLAAFGAGIIGWLRRKKALAWK